MRRRIYCGREGLIDATTQWSLWGMAPWESDPDPLPVLENARNK